MPGTGLSARSRLDATAMAVLLLLCALRGSAAMALVAAGIFLVNRPDRRRAGA